MEKISDVKNCMNITVLIPAYKPKEDLISISNKLIESGYKLVVVNDGSGNKYRDIFNRLPIGAVLLSHTKNRGKGCAIKTGLDYIYQNQEFCDAVITADADGEFSFEDIEQVATELRQSTNKRQIVIGSRVYEGVTPIRYRVESFVKRLSFLIVSGTQLYDIQTGLRGFTRELFLMMLGVPGERYEYGIDTLLQSIEYGVEINEIYLSPVKVDENTDFHYHALRDTLKIFSRLLMFVFSSLAATVLELGILYILRSLMAGVGDSLSLFFALVVARAASATMNYHINKTVIFKQNGDTLKTAVKFFSLVFTTMMGTYALLWLFNVVCNIGLFFSSMIAYFLMFLVNFQVQRRLVFKKKFKDLPEE